MALIRFAAWTAAVFCIALPVFAADIAPGDTIIVTATRTEIPLEQATVPVRVITRDDIELSLATDLAELLRFEAGIDIGRNGGPGQATSMFLRGTESNHVLVLIDGVRMNPGTLGGAAIQHVSPEVIERVEIVKGARSALFGTDAIGGVINIITRRAEETSIEAGAGAGSFDSRSAFASAGTRGENNRYGITVDWQDSAGYPSRVESEIDRGYENVSLNAYATRDIGRGEIGLRHWRAEGMVEYLDFFLTPVDQDFLNSTTAFEFDRQIGERGTSKFVAAYMQDEIQQNQSEDFVESDRRVRAGPVGTRPTSHIRRVAPHGSRIIR
jgi:vitamin B12 transporter